MIPIYDAAMVYYEREVHASKLHGGAEHRGAAVNCIHIYMSEQGKESRAVGEPAVSEVVYDFRTEKHLCVLVYLHDTSTHRQVQTST